MISLSDILVMLEVGEIGYPEPNSYQAPVHISQFIRSCSGNYTRSLTPPNSRTNCNPQFTSRGFFLVLLALSEALYEETVLAGKCHRFVKEEGRTLSLTFWKLKIL